MKKNLTLKLLTRVVCLAATILTVYVILTLLSNTHNLQGFALTKKLGYLSYYGRLLVLSVMILFVAYKGKGNKGTYLLASFWAGYILNNVIGSMLVADSLAEIFTDSTTSAIVGSLFIYSLQYFPERIDAAGVNSTIKGKWLRRYLTWMLNPINLWLYFGLIIFGLYLAKGFSGIQVPLPDLIIMITGLLFMVINYRRSAAKGRNSILWFLWGVLALVLLSIFLSLLSVFSMVQGPHVHVVASLLETFILLTTLFMSIFFADSFDTGVIIKRTLIDGLLFLIVILFYNTIEHFAMHSINEYLGISDVFASSLLSGVLVLVLSPLHHRLSNFLNHKLKRTNGPHDATAVHHQEQHIDR